MSVFCQEPGCSNLPNSFSPETKGNPELRYLLVRLEELDESIEALQLSKVELENQIKALFSGTIK